MIKPDLEVWGYNSYRPFRIYWILHEYGLKYIAHRIGSRTGETQTKEYLEDKYRSALWLIKSIDQYVLTNYSIEFSELQSYGNALNRNLIFNNLYIIHNDRMLIQAAEFELGLSFKPLNLFNFLNINRILIKDGFFDK